MFRGEGGRTGRGNWGDVAKGRGSWEMGLEVVGGWG